MRKAGTIVERTNLRAYNNSSYQPGGNALKRTFWHFINRFIFQSGLLPFYGPKIVLLRWFGAHVGERVTLKPGVNIKYPWNLTVGDDTWIGENVWLDCLVAINIGANVCLSQGAMILTGSHNYKRSSFDLMTASVTIEDGVWIGASAIVTAGVSARSHAVLAAGSVATKDLDAYAVYQGNPATKKRDRTIQ